MLEIEKGSYQESKMHLQNIGLEVNEMKQQGQPIPYEMVQLLLDYAINVVDKADSTMSDLIELFDQVPVR